MVQADASSLVLILRLRDAQAQLGHWHMTTLEIYTHVTDDAQRDAVELIGGREQVRTADLLLDKTSAD